MHPLLREIHRVLSEPRPLDEVLPFALAALARHSGARAALLLPGAGVYGHRRPLQVGDLPFPGDMGERDFVRQARLELRVQSGSVDPLGHGVAIPLQSGAAPVGVIVLLLPESSRQAAAGSQAAACGAAGPGLLLWEQAAARITRSLVLAQTPETIALTTLQHLSSERESRRLLAHALAEARARLGGAPGLLWLALERGRSHECVVQGVPAAQAERLEQQLPPGLRPLESRCTVTVLPADVSDLPWPSPLVYVPLGHPGELLGGAVLAGSLPAGDAGLGLQSMLTLAAQLAIGQLRARDGGQLRLLRERQRLARGLHESLQRSLQNLTLGMRSAEAIVRHDPTRSMPLLERMQQLVGSFQGQVQGLFFHLRPDHLSELGLVAALETLAEHVRLQQGLEVETSLAQLRLPHELQESLYYIGLEALENARRHANCRHIQLTLAGRRGWVALSVADDGQGFDPQRAQGQGLQAMREHCRQAGGQLFMESGPLVGTHVRVELPWPDGG